MDGEKRRYQKSRRAELEQRTRLRITKSTVELHGTLGPSRTTISAVAKRAGVRRATVYRHFPDEAALFMACSSHWAAANPPPDLAQWAAIRDPDERLSTALGELYVHYHKTQRMMENVFRDEDTMPIVKQMLGGFRDYIAAAQEALMEGREPLGRTRQRALAAIGHALAFSTWRSLAREQGLGDHEAADLMCLLVKAATRSLPVVS